MVVNFSELDFKERPTLVLKNLDGTPIQPLAYAFDVKAKLMYNEVSELSFELPAYVDGEKTPHYDDVVGMRIIDWVGIGQFILVNPSIKDNGVSEMKSCTAYSLEYELTYKKIFIEDGTYPFWDPIKTENTVVSIILELFPSWKVGYIDKSLYNKYRTFEVTDQTAYDFMKGTLQDKYQCIFDFDTYERSINAYSVESLVETSPVLLSHKNLIKEIKIDEETEEIFTCLDVNGADGVDIRSVNPTGKNDLYDLSYFMNESYFDPNAPETSGIIDGYHSWETAVNDKRLPYYLLTVSKVLNEAKLEGARAGLTKLENELSTLEVEQSVYVEAIAQGAGDDSIKASLSAVKTKITAKKAEITDKKAEIETISKLIADQLAEQEDINEYCSLSTYLTPAQLDIIDRYVKKDALSDDSFVYRDIASYEIDDISEGHTNAIFTIKDSECDVIELSDGKQVNRYHGGTITFHNDDHTIEADLIDAIMNVEDDGTINLTASLDTGYIGEADNWSPGHAITSYGYMTTTRDFVCDESDAVTLLIGDRLTIDRNGNTKVVDASSVSLRYGDSLSQYVGEWTSPLRENIKSWSWYLNNQKKKTLRLTLKTGIGAGPFMYYVKDLDKATKFENANLIISGNKLKQYTAYGGYTTWHIGQKKFADSGVMFTLSDSEVVASNTSVGSSSALIIAKTLSFNPGSKYCITVNGQSHVEKAPEDGVIVVDGVTFNGTTSIANNSGKSVQVKVEQLDTSAYLYFTVKHTEFSKRSVEWDLMQYGEQVLHDKAYPSYVFSVDSANFFAADDFVAFKNKLKLGNRVYVQLADEKTLTPIVIGVEVGFDDPSDLTIIFGDKYSARDSAFKLVDLLEQSVSMGKSLSLKRINYNSFVDSGASSRVHDFMKSALDASVNAVLAGSGQAVTLDQSGLRLRKSDGNGGFEDEQLWAISNGIVFTRDGWDTAEMAIGKFHDSNFDGELWGVVAPSIVGTILAGESLVIETSKKATDSEDSPVVFRVDKEGAQLHNASFDLLKGTGHISLYPDTGLVGGVSTVASPLFTYENGSISGIRTANGDTLTSVADIKQDNLPNANFWLDMKGNAYFKGTVYADSGKFSGTVDAKDLQLNGTSISSIFKTTTDDESQKDFLKIGNMTISLDDEDLGSIKFENTQLTLVKYSTDKINWTTEWNESWSSSQTVVYAKYSYDGGSSWSTYPIQIQSKNGDPGSSPSLPSYIKSTYIDFSRVESPLIVANAVRTLGSFQIGYGSRTSFTSLGYIGAAYGKDASEQMTEGIAIMDSGTYDASDGTVTYDTNGRYLIVTNAGIRMQAGSHSITVTQNGAFYDGNEIGSGSGTAVFG